jgi:exodeoxyribonuclease VII large subunit
MKPENSALNLDDMRLSGTIDAAAEGIFTVSQLNQTVARMLERNFPLLQVRGEISNLTRATSGHWYFTLKDDAAQVRCAMFRGRAQYAGFVPTQGDAVEIRAQVRLYEPRGEFQLVVDSMRRSGAGALLEAFNRLKTELAAEGLFDAERKRPLPGFARRVGIVTSSEAAALRDVASTLAARAPHVQAILYPTPVQGEGSAQKIAAAITLANTRAEVDVLIVCRGGGSIEDLWAFNEVVVARAIAASAIPVISGVGHETDVTIADFVADARAPTPTGAAQMAVRPRSDWLLDIEARSFSLRKASARIWERLSMRLDAASGRLQSPARQIDARFERVDALREKLLAIARRKHESLASRVEMAALRWRRSQPDVASAHRQLEQVRERLRMAVAQRWKQQQQRIGHLAAVLEAAGPQATLRRGYAMVERRGQLLGTVAQAAIGDALTVSMADGKIETRVESIEFPVPGAGQP